MGLSSGLVYLQSRQNQMRSLWEVFRHLATLLSLHHVLPSDVHGVFPESEWTKLLDKTLPAQSSWCDHAVDGLCIMAEMRQTEVGMGYCQAGTYSQDKKWDIKMGRETSHLHTDLRTPDYSPWSWQWGHSLYPSLYSNTSRLAFKFTIPRFLGGC